MIYGSFARVYDQLMDDVPYDEWAGYLVRCLREDGIEDGLVLDLGCGTGKMTRLLSQAGYDMIGADASAEMLEIAREQEENEGFSRTGLAGTRGWAQPRILYLEQDMCSFELYGTVRAIVSVCDCLNYLLTQEDLLQVFRLANNYLDPGGLFLFDMSTAYKYETELGDDTFAQTGENFAYIWENAWFEEDQINQYDLTLFFKEADGRYSRHHELHTQRAYSTDTIVRLLQEAGLKVERVEEAYTGRPLQADSDRVLFVAREQGKKSV